MQEWQRGISWKIGGGVMEGTCMKIDEVAETPHLNDAGSDIPYQWSAKKLY